MSSLNAGTRIGAHDWSLGTVDLRTGVIEKVSVDQRFDVHGATWTTDGGVLAVTLGIHGPLMRFRRLGSPSSPQ